MGGLRLTSSESNSRSKSKTKTKDPSTSVSRAEKRAGALLRSGCVSRGVELAIGALCEAPILCRLCGVPTTEGTRRKRVPPHRALT
jgi:hypothetical protein